MSQVIKFRFNDDEEALDIINTGGDLVSYLSTQSPTCPLIGSDIKLVKKLGEGTRGAVFLLKIKGMGSKKYVAKKIRTTGSVHTNDPYKTGLDTIGKLATAMQEERLVSAKTLVAINGYKDWDTPITKKDKIYFPTYAHICLTEYKKTYDRVDGSGVVIIPKGSYLCNNSQYSEYIIGVLCGNLYRGGRSVNFIDVFGFATCPDNKKYVTNQYIFMEIINISLSSLGKCIFSYKKVFAEVLMVQVLHAIACYQREYKIQHNDLHNENIFIEYITPTTTFNGQNLHDADWFHYKIDNVNIYLPWVPALVKIGDFGLSVKYSAPIVGDMESVDGGYEAVVPNWYAECYDTSMILKEFYTGGGKRSSFIRNIMGWMIDPKIKNPDCRWINSAIRDGYNTLTGRPRMPFVSGMYVHATPTNILSNNSLMKRYLTKPIDGTIVTLGTI